MAITAAKVKELRKMTGAEMMFCKIALMATEDDMDKAVEFLREKGFAKMGDFDIQETRRQQGVSYNEEHNWSSESGGLGIGNFQAINNQFEEEKFHARQGHGFAAERANTLFDKLSGHDAKIVGDDNAKNGADRIVDGVYIQSKYCATGSRCINECFENDGKGFFRYMNNGKPMQIEVPSDKYDDAIRAMEEKIRRGQVEGVSNPEEAKNIVRKGHFTYEQARNIAKAGTVESLTYDAVNGTIIATSAFGVTALITLATSVWGGEDFDKALKLATYSGLKVGGTAFVTSILASQLSKAGLNSALVGSSEAIVVFMGPKASAVLINAFRYGSKPIYGAAAMKSAAKLLRGNVITAGITFVVLSAFDVADIFSGRISGKQLFKNLANTAATVGGGTGGWIAGAAAGSAILPGIGTVIGGLVGSMFGGTAAGKVTNTVVGKFVEDDADEMVEIIESVFTDMVGEYLLSQKEAENAVDRLQEKLDGKILKDMYGSDSRRAFARNMLTPIIEGEIARRSVIPALTETQMITSVRNVLEEIADEMEKGDLVADLNTYAINSSILEADDFMNSKLRTNISNTSSETAKNLFNMGQDCYLGRGCKVDQCMAVKYYNDSARLGYMPAELKLGKCYEYGYGCSKDKQKAFTWYEKAAEHGNMEAQYKVGTCCEFGRGCTIDKAKAVTWYKKAAAQGHKEAMAMLTLTK